MRTDQMVTALFGSLTVLAAASAAPDPSRTAPKRAAPAPRLRLLYTPVSGDSAASLSVTQPSTAARFPMVVQHVDASQYPIVVAGTDPARFPIRILTPPGDGVPARPAPSVDPRLYPVAGPRILISPPGKR